MREDHEGRKAVNSTKNRLLYLMKYLYEQTDENHQADTYQLLSFLESRQIPTDRKTLRADLKTLIDAGMDIVVVRSKPNRYFWGERLLELPEMRLLFDAVSASRFITAKKSRHLMEKLGRIVSVFQRKKLERGAYIADAIKPLNENIYYIVDKIDRAILDEKRVSFLYSDYTPDKEKFLRNDGMPYVVSPYALYWNDDYYYLIGWSEKHEEVSAFRVDRIVEVEILPEKAVPVPPDFDIENYARQMLKMYSGEMAMVKMECENNLMRYIVDRFGEDVITERISDRKFCVNTEVALSPTFYAWVFQFGGGIQIVSPEKAVLGIRNMAWGIVGRKMEVKD